MYLFVKCLSSFIARDAFVRTNRRAIAMIFVCLSVRLSETGVHCDHTVHASADFSLWSPPPGRAGIDSIHDHWSAFSTHTHTHVIIMTNSSTTVNSFGHRAPLIGCPTFIRCWSGWTVQPASKCLMTAITFSCSIFSLSDRQLEALLTIRVRSPQIFVSVERVSK